MGRKAPFHSQWPGYWQEKQRSGPPETALPQTAGSYADHPSKLSKWMQPREPKRHLGTPWVRMHDLPLQRSVPTYKWKSPAASGW